MEFIFKCHFSRYYSVCINSADKQIPFRECLNSQSPRQYRHKFRPLAMSNINIIGLILKNVVPRRKLAHETISSCHIGFKGFLKASLYDIRFKSYGSISAFHVFCVTLTLTFDISRYSRYFSKNHIKYPGISI